MDQSSASTSTQSSSSHSAESSGSSKIRKVNSSLFELHKPMSAASIQILFFHGLQPGNYSDAHLTSWESSDKSCIWPQTWLVQECPNAHVFAVSYTDCLGNRSNQNFDIYVIAESLLSDMLKARVGQRSYCPVVLVGHSLGGLVIKKICCLAHGDLGRSQEPRRSELENFLKNIAGVFYYATPHNGTEYANNLRNFQGSLRLLEFFQVLNKDAARLSIAFEKTRKMYPYWSLAGLGESCNTILGLLTEVKIVPEASAKSEDFSIVEGYDHFSISRPKDKTAQNYQKLLEFVLQIEKKAKEGARKSQDILKHKEAKVPFHHFEGLSIYSTQLERHAQEVIQKLKSGPVLGIFGMGGIGKTTLAREVFNTISRDYEYTCFANNVKGIPSRALESQLCTLFYHNGVMKNDAQWSDSKDKKTLIVLDDVDSPTQLTVLPKLEDFGKGSNLIITSRDQHNFTFYNDCVVHEVELLKMDEAKKLFCQHVFGREEIPDIPPGRDVFESLVHALVDKCNRLPLTLEVIGQYLRDNTKDPEFWKQTIWKLGDAQMTWASSGDPDDRVWASLRVSYDALTVEEQEMFIDAATVLFERPLSQALAVWSLSNDSSEKTWANLLSKSMVKEISPHEYGDNYHFEELECKVVWVHEHLRDLAKKVRDCHMVSGSAEDASSIIDKLNENELNPKTTSLRLYDTNSVLKLDSLAKLKELRFLQLSYARTRWGARRMFAGELGSVLEHKVLGKSQLPKKLSTLVWSGGVFPFRLSNMDNLAVLEVKNCIMWEEVVEAFMNLTNLRVLSLMRLSGPILPKSIGKLKALEHLSLTQLNCEELPESISDLSSLRVMEIHSLRNLHLLRPSFGRNLKSLKHLSVKGCENLEHLPQCFSQLSALERLVIADCSSLQFLEGLGDIFGDLSELRQLELSRSGLQRLPHSFVRLSALEELVLDSLPLDRFPDHFDKLKGLKKLLIRSEKMETLPDSIGLLPSLRELEVSCEKLQKLPENIGELAQLEKLDVAVYPLDHAKRAAFVFPESLGKLTSLKTLLVDVPHLESLPESISQLRSLTSLKLRLDRVRSLKGIGRLSALQEIILFAREIYHSRCYDVAASWSDVLKSRGRKVVIDDYYETARFGLRVTLYCCRVRVK